MKPKGKGLILASSVFIIIFAVFSLIMAFVFFSFTGSQGAEFLAQIGASEILEAYIPGISIAEAEALIDEMMPFFGITGAIFLIIGIYQLLLGILGLFFSGNRKRASILVVMAIIALIFQSIIVVIYLFSDFSTALFLIFILFVYVMFLTGALRNLQAKSSSTEIIGYSDETLMSAVSGADKE
jgi:hypothetical protein